MSIEINVFGQAGGASQELTANHQRTEAIASPKVALLIGNLYAEERLSVGLTGNGTLLRCDLGG